MKKNRITYKALFLVLLAAFVLSLVPMLLAARYNVPCADDYSYGISAHSAYLETGSVLAAVKAAVQHTVDIYRIWQGSFSAVFLMALQPAVFGEELYFIGTIIILAALVAGGFCFCIELFSGVFGLEKSVGGIIAVVVLTACIQLVLSPAQGFFWYNGSVYYGFFYGLALLAIALGIRAVRKGSVWALVFSCLLAFAVGGGNYVTALSSSIIACSSVLLLALMKNKAWKKMLLPTVLLLAGFLISVAAPGNAVRQVSTQHTPDALWAIRRSFEHGAQYSVQWLSLPLAGAMLFLGVVFWDNVSRTRFVFRYPGLVTAYSYCLFSAMFCPTNYAFGGLGADRTTNIIFYAYILLLAINIFYWIGWAKPRIMKAREQTGKFPLRALLAAAACCLICCGVYARSHGFTSLMALGTVRSGEAQTYYACAQERLEKFKNGVAEDLMLEPYPVLPYVMFFDDFSTDPEDWKNTAVCAYYGENSVALTAGYC